MTRSKILRIVFAVVAFSPLALVVSGEPGVGREPPAPGTPGGSATPDNRFTRAQGLSPQQRVAVAKTMTSRLARSDDTLLARTDANPVQVVIKLDYDPVATYAGNIAGYPATSPTATGRKLTGGPAEQRYEQYIADREVSFLAALRQKLPTAETGQRLRTVYGGVTLTAPANQLREIAGIAGVVAIQADQLHQPLTDSSPAFIGADSGPGGAAGGADAGAGVIVGVLDTGVWPEHPSFAEGTNPQSPPLKTDGTPRTCDFGDNPLTSAADPFACNRKLIGGATFLTSYLADPVRAATEKYRTARDSQGHGTHTASTSAGSPVARTKVLGTERGAIHGVAPAAWVSAYKVCGGLGCLSSDGAAAVGQAIKDGVQVINFSISGGRDPFTDAVELAFLDAYAAGVFVAAAAGNDGPGAGTGNHLAPWVTTVGASTQRREFSSTLTVTAGGVTRTFDGASITGGAGPAPIVLAESVTGYEASCAAPAGKDTFAGKIVACERGGTPRIVKGHNVKQGGAVGMVLYNPNLQDVETDNHWLPTVHLPDGTAFKSFLQAHPQGATARFTGGTARDGRADVMAAFSARGPVGQFVKPDLTAPGVQILAGHTPAPATTAGGPPGELFQALAGTSMAAPHVAGAAAWLRSRHPDWTPARIRSALMTTATTVLVKEDLKTRADPFDMGAGRIRVDLANEAGLVFDETPARLSALGGDPVGGVHLNLPSINAPVVPGRLTTVRTATNVTGRTLTYQASTTAPEGSTITVRPATVVVLPGRSVELSITVQSAAPTRQYFGEVRLDPVGASGSALHLPVAFVPKQGTVTLASGCVPDTMAVGQTSSCTVTAHNTSFDDATASLVTTTDPNLRVAGASGAMIIDDHRVEVNAVRLPGAVPAKPSLQQGSLFGYVPLDRYGVTPTKVGDDEIINFTLPNPTLYGGQSYNKIGVTSNGYVVVGGGEAADVQCCNLTRLPDPARPNNVLAPFWTDLDGTGAPGIYTAELTATDGGRWLVVEWRLNVFGGGTASGVRTFQLWMRLGGVESVGFAYPTTSRPTDPGLPYLVGAENVNGSAGEQLPAGTLPTTDLKVITSSPTPGGSLTYTIMISGDTVGAGSVVTNMNSPQIPGVTSVTSRVTVRPPGASRAR